MSFELPVSFPLLRAFQAQNGVRLLSRKLRKKVSKRRSIPLKTRGRAFRLKYRAGGTPFLRPRAAERASRACRQQGPCGPCLLVHALENPCARAGPVFITRGVIPSRKIKMTTRSGAPAGAWILFPHRSGGSFAALSHRPLISMRPSVPQGALSDYLCEMVLAVQPLPLLPPSRQRDTLFCKRALVS